MFTFATLLGASGTLVASGVAERILSKKGKEDLAETLRKLTFLGVYGYGLWWCLKVVMTAGGIFL